MRITQAIAVTSAAVLATARSLALASPALAGESDTGNPTIVFGDSDSPYTIFDNEEDGWSWL